MKYYLGLDIGTSSCGWAVTNENYSILKIKGKKAWGVRLFDPAEDAKTRRQKRGSRRRLVRSKLRIQWLNEIFAKEIAKMDPYFLTRIKYSNLYLEDKKIMNNKINSKDSLFNDEKFNDQNFYKKYPTIYHLRQKLINEEAEDIRFLYLAIHNLLKARGHFLFEGNIGENDSIKNQLNLLIDFINKIKSDNFINIDIELSPINNEEEKSFIQIVCQKDGIKNKVSKLGELLKLKNKNSIEFVSSLVSGKINIGNIFEIDKENNVKLNFHDEDILEQIENLKDILSEEQIMVVEKMQNIFSIIELKKILRDNNYICDAMVEQYNQHKKQIKDFKMFIRKYYPNQYFNMFRKNMFKDNKDKDVNYARYVGNDKFNNKKHRFEKSERTPRGEADFYKYVLSVIKENPEASDENFENEKNKIILEIENGTFLLKQRRKANAIIPNKVLEMELMKILETNRKKFKFLDEVDESSLTNVEKINQIFKFRIPYFIGPIGETEYGWVKKKSNEILKPWTLNKIVDFDEAEDSFISRLTNKCTYLKDEDVLPKHSILFEKFKVLNELNNLKINGEKISVKLKQGIFTNLFESKKTVKIKDVKNYLVAEGQCTLEEVKDLVFSGIDKEFISNCGSYVKLITSEQFDKRFVDDNLDMFEKIIKYHTIISDKNRLENRVRREFGDKLNDQQIKYIKSLNYSEWGTLSKKFLTGNIAKMPEGERTSIIEEMWNTNQNLQQIYNDTSKYNKDELLKNESERKSKDLLYEDVENLYCSPAVKRGVWQTVKIIKELKDLLGEYPDKIFVEVTRGDEEKGDAGRKLSRKTTLNSIYTSQDFKNSVKNLSIDLGKLNQELNTQEDLSFRSEKLYLYFLQMGKCMYSGEDIDLKDLFDDHKYDVDHIIPQSKLKDDSINNKVLVKSEYNSAKDNTYPIYLGFPEWVNKMLPYWNLLLKLKLLSQEKFDRLTRKSFTESDLNGFIARQIVETNQTAKAVIDLLKEVVNKPTDVVYSKARYVSDFRNKYGIYKSRMINDLHHAKDAYLNIVVGNVIKSRFIDDPRNIYAKKDKEESDGEKKPVTGNIGKLFDFKIYSALTKECVWNGEDDVKRIKEEVLKNDCLVTRMHFANYNGAFWDETLYNKSEKNIYSQKCDPNNPISNPEKYGGYGSLNNAYFMLIESIEKKDKKIKTIEPVPILIYQRYKNDKNKNEKILEYIKEENKLKDPKILIEKIDYKTTLKIGDGTYWISGKTGGSYIIHNANQWWVDNDTIEYVKAIEKYISIKNQFKDRVFEEKENKIIISQSAKDGNKEVYISKEKNEKLYNDILKQIDKNIYKDMQIGGDKYKGLLNNSKEKINNLKVSEQAELLNEILKRIGTGGSASNLTQIDGTASSGCLTLGKNITDKNIKIIQESVTGLFRKEKRL